MDEVGSDVELTTLERAVINAFQGGFPVAERPWEPAAAALAERGVDVDAAELLATVRDLDDRGVLSRFGALVNAEAIGGTATLVAMHAPEERYDEVAETVNDFREVAHNYEREHPHLNMWFVVSVADEAAVERVLADIEAATGQETYNLPKREEFHVGAKFLLDGPVPDGDLDLSHLGPAVEPSDERGITARERDLVVEIQGGTPRHGDAVRRRRRGGRPARRVGRRDDQAVRAGGGKVRRVGVIPNHYALGYTENGMTVWDVPDDLLEEVGPAVASLGFVTHCYHRPRHEGVWPYNFFAMTHGRDEAESERRIEQVRDTMTEFWDVADDEWDSLFSTRILKKTGIRLDERADAQVRDEEADPADA